MSSLSIAPIGSLQDSHVIRPPILDRAAAEQRLSSITPGTEEHTQLSRALIKALGIVEIYLTNLTYKVYTQRGHLLGGFGSSEHFFIGEQLSLSELENKALLRRGDVCITFGHIIALAGDFYGVPHQPISLLGGSDRDKEDRFLAAFATLENANPEQVRRLVTGIEEEYHEVRHSAAPHHCYSSRLISSNHRFKEIKGDIDDLLVDNSDHFCENAREAYLIGHTLACQEAARAGASQNQDQLRRAYALEAFACHFLTDLFAAGHIRNQRGPLELFLRGLGFSSAASKSLSGVLTGSQHEYDGEKGLEVFTPETPEAPGERWRAYGDGFFFSPKNETNQNKAIQVVQQSVNEVADAFRCRSSGPTRMENRIPKSCKFNHDPLYEIEAGQLFIFSNGKRVPIQSKKDYLLQAIPLALGVLPESYVNGFIDSYIFPFRIELPVEISNIQEVLATVIVPRIERLTGKLWHVIGIASFAQVKEVAERDAALTQELMETAKTTYEQGKKILRAVTQLAARIEALHLRLKVDPIQTATRNIQESFLKLQTVSALDSQQLNQIEGDLYRAAFALMNIFLNEQENSQILSDRPILLAYAEIQFPDQSREEKTLEATRWFRLILRYEIAAFSTYLNLKYRRVNNPSGAIDEIRSFQHHLNHQINANREFVYPEILSASSAYADHRLKIIQQQNAFLTFIETPEEVVQS